MSKMTYKEFGELVTGMGYEITPGQKLYISVHDGNFRTIASVSRTHYKQLNLDWSKFEKLTENEREVLADACWRLASTPLEDREEPKKYHLKVCQKYLPFFSGSYEYLNIVRHTGRIMIATKDETHLCKTIFTEEEINELAKEYDLSLFEKVEVEDE